MAMFRRKLCLFLFVVSVSSTTAHIYFSGDAGIQPRLDVKTYQDKSTGAPISQKRSIDGYYLYRARINIKADVADGFFFQTRLSTNTLDNWNKMGDNSRLASTKSHGTSTSGPVDFLQLYIGYKKDKLGLDLGKLPMDHNILLDTHHYPDHPLDLPYLLIGNQSFTGMKLSYVNLETFAAIGTTTVPTYYEGQGIKLSSEYNSSETQTESSHQDEHVNLPNATVNDQLTFGFNYKIQASKALTLTPTGIVTLSAVDEINQENRLRGVRSPARITTGLLMKQKISKKTRMNLAVGYSMGQVSQNADDFHTDQHQKSDVLVGHTGLTFRELGVGDFKVFAQYAQIRDYPWSNIENRFQVAEYYAVSYVHVQYTVTLAKKDHRMVTLKPTFRYLLHTSSDDEQGYVRHSEQTYDWYNRIKAELTYNVTF